MGLGGISPWSLLLILVIVLLLFGTKKLKGLGGDLGGAIKGFKKAMNDENAKSEQESESKDDVATTDTESEKTTPNDKA